MTPDLYARGLLGELGEDAPGRVVPDSRPEAVLWAESGASFLTGEADGPALPSPVPLATAARGAWLALSALSEGALDPHFPAHQLLGERAAILGLRRRGAVAPGGACHLLSCEDGYIALNLPREDDWRLLPAWLECDADSLDTVTRVVRNRPCEPLVSRARLLGLAAAVSRPPSRRDAWYRETPVAQPARAPRRAPLVIDLSTIWAGPLCANLLGEMGARVIKVESLARPDGARRGPAPFFDLLNGRKESVMLDLDNDNGREQLRQLLRKADIVVESARPRGLEQMNIHAAELLAESNGLTWLSITGYGRREPVRDWIAYGDDAGVEAGLCALLQESSGATVFCGDAIADPLTGLHAALLAWQAWRRGGGVLLDVPLVGTVARCINEGMGDGDHGGEAPAALPPVARPARQRAPVPGSATGSVLAELGITH